jgi:hypothetical protein
MRVMVRSIEMSPDSAGPIAAVVLLTVLIATVADAQLMSTCTENSPERRGELGCSIIESKLLPADLREPVFWHIDRFDSLARARAAVNQASVAFEAAGTAWLMTIEPRYSDHHGGLHVTHVGPLPLPKATRYSMVVQSAVFRRACIRWRTIIRELKPYTSWTARRATKLPRAASRAERARRSCFLPAPKCVPWSAVQRAGMYSR